MTKKYWCPLCGQEGEVEFLDDQFRMKCCLENILIYHTSDPQEVIDKQEEIKEKADCIIFEMQEILEQMEEEKENNMKTYYCSECGSSYEFSLDDISPAETFPVMIRNHCYRCKEQQFFRRDLKDAILLNQHKLEHLDRQTNKAIEARRKLGEYNE